MVMDREGRRVLSLFTALHAAYMETMVTGTQRPIRFFEPDTLAPRVVIPATTWEQIVSTQGSSNTETVFDMCFGHPRSLARVKKKLEGGRACAGYQYQHPHPSARTIT